MKFLIFLLATALLAFTAHGDKAAPDSSPLCGAGISAEWSHGPEGSQGSSTASLQCTANGYIVTVVSPANIDEVVFQLGSVNHAGVFVPSENPDCTCTVPARNGHPNCRASWTRDGQRAAFGLVSQNVAPKPTKAPATPAPILIPVNDDLYARKKRSAESAPLTSTLTFEHGQCDGLVEEVGGSYEQTVYLRVKEYLLTPNAAILLATQSDVAVKCENVVVPPAEEMVLPPVNELRAEVAVCKSLHFNIAASVLGDHEKIQVNISRDNLLEADTQHSWIVKSLKYHQDIVIGNHSPKSPLMQSINTRVETLVADVFRVETDYVLLDSSESLPISADIGYRLHPNVQPSANIKPCPALVR